MDMKYLDFNDVSTIFSERKTKTYHVVSRMVGLLLGEICWYSHWRKYCFRIIADNPIFDSNCLQEIASFLIEQNKLYKDKSNVTK